MPPPSSPAQISTLVTELGGLPNDFDTLHTHTRKSALTSLRTSLNSSSPPAFVRVLVLRSVSRLLGPTAPPDNASWTALPLWDEAALETLFKLLVDALDERGYDALDKKLSTLPVTPSRAAEELSDFGKLMLTPQEQAALAESPPDSESDEEMLFITVPSIFPEPPEIPFSLQAAISASQPAQLAAAHVSHALGTTARHDRAPAVRRAALLALGSLARAMPLELLAAFLPGLASTLARGLQNTTIEQAPIVVAGFDTFAAVVFGAFPAVGRLSTGNTEQKNVASSFAAALAQHRSRSSAKSSGSAANDQTGKEEPESKAEWTKSRGLSVSRNASWSSVASREVSLRVRLFLEAHSGPSSHTSVRARLALTRFAHVALSDTSTLVIDPYTRCLLIFALVEMAGDWYPVVRNEALQAVNRLLRRRRVKVKEFEHGFRSLVKAVNNQDELFVVGSDAQQKPRENGDKIYADGNGEPRHVMMDVIGKLMSVKEEGFWVRLCDGYLRILVPSQEDVSVGKVSVLSRSDTIAGSLVRIGVDQFCNMLISMHEAIWTPVAEKEGSRFAELDNRVLATAFQMGRAGLLPSLYSSLFSFGSWNIDDENDEPRRTHLTMLSSFKTRAHSVLILQAVIRGAIAKTTVPEDEVRGHMRHIIQCVKDVLNSMTAFLLPTLDESESDVAWLVDDTMVSLKRCLLHCESELVKELSAAHARLLSKPLGSDVILVVLLSLLKDVSHGEKSVRETALESLRSIARIARCRDERKLIGRHLNFLISRLVGHLGKRWAGDVLGFIVGDDGDAISEEATFLLEGTLRVLNNSLAGAGDSRALRSLAAIQNVLQTAVGQRGNLDSKFEESLGDKKCNRNALDLISEDDSAKLHQKLLFYCTEYVDDYRSLTVAKKEETADVEENEEEENDSHSAFEALALSTLDGMRDLLVGRPWNVRASALSCATCAVYLLRDNQKDLLPHAANILPLLPEQFVVLQRNLSPGDRLLDRIKQKKLRGKEDAMEIEDLVKYLNGKGAELPVVTNACLLLSALAQCAGSFINTKFVKVIFPRMRLLLRLASCYPTLVGSSVTAKGKLLSPPSYGSMSASDACLKAIAAMALVLPEALAPHCFAIVKHLIVFFGSQHDPRSTAQRNVAHLNRSMLRYERGRWQKRTTWAEVIIQCLKSVNPGDVLSSLLCNEKSAPRNIDARHSTLCSVRISKSQTPLG